MWVWVWVWVGDDVDGGLALQVGGQDKGQLVDLRMS